jgi:glutathione peroxidase
MMLSNVIIVAAVCAIVLAAVPTSPPSAPAPRSPQNPAEGEWKSRSIYTIETHTLEGKPAKLSAYDGKVALIVNVASECGYTVQYAGLEKLHDEFKDEGLVVLGFPCNDFGGQEPGSPKEIRAFCTEKYNVTFPLFEKLSLKPGDEQHVLYKALEAKTNKLPRWNFCKYLVSRDGTTAQFFDSKVTPESDELRTAIEKALHAR